LGGEIDLVENFLEWHLNLRNSDLILTVKPRSTYLHTQAKEDRWKRWELVIYKQKTPVP
jgi:hypothetical protein